MSLILKLKDCPNYDKIVNFLYEENDLVSKLLIDCYQEYLFKIKSSKSRTNIDNIMNLYTDKTLFYKYVQEYFNILSSSEIYDSYDKVILKLIKLYKTYEVDKVRKINNSRWI